MSDFISKHSKALIIGLSLAAVATIGGGFIYLKFFANNGAASQPTAGQIEAENEDEDAAGKPGEDDGEKTPVDGVEGDTSLRSKPEDIKINPSKAKNPELAAKAANDSQQFTTTKRTTEDNKAVNVISSAKGNYWDNAIGRKDMPLGDDAASKAIKGRFKQLIDNTVAAANKLTPNCGEMTPELKQYLTNFASNIYPDQFAEAAYSGASAKNNWRVTDYHVYKRPGDGAGIYRVVVVVTSDDYTNYYGGVYDDAAGRCSMPVSGSASDDK